jgi:hypothetical protein
MGLHWLRIDRPCILEVPQLKDYAGQALVFRPPGLVVRCVTSDVFEHPLVKAYRDQYLLVEVGENGAAFVPAAATVVEQAPETQNTPPEVPVPAPETVVPVETTPTEPVVETPPEEVAPAKDGEDIKGFELKRRRR